MFEKSFDRFLTLQRLLVRRLLQRVIEGRYLLLAILNLFGCLGQLVNLILAKSYFLGDKIMIHIIRDRALYILCDLLEILIVKMLQLVGYLLTILLILGALRLTFNRKFIRRLPLLDILPLELADDTTLLLDGY